MMRNGSRNWTEELFPKEVVFEMTEEEMKLDGMA